MFLYQFIFFWLLLVAFGDLVDSGFRSHSFADF